MIPSPVVAAPWHDDGNDNDPITRHFIDYVGNAYAKSHEEEEQVDPMDMPVRWFYKLIVNTFPIYL